MWKRSSWNVKCSMSCEFTDAEINHRREKIMISKYSKLNLCNVITTAYGRMRTNLLTLDTVRKTNAYGFIKLVCRCDEWLLIRFAANRSADLVIPPTALFGGLSESKSRSEWSAFTSSSALEATAPLGRRLYRPTARTGDSYVAARNSRRELPRSGPRLRGTARTAPTLNKQNAVGRTKIHS